MIIPTQTTAPEFWPARDQDIRPTCLAFASSDLNGYAHKTTEPLSVEYLCHHAAKLTPGWNHSQGFTVWTVLKVIESLGQPVESFYAYRKSEQNAPLDMPPKGTPNIYKSACKGRKLGIDDIIDKLMSRLPVGIVVAVSETFFNPTAGVVQFSPMVLPNQLHALLAVGVGKHKVTNELFVHVRNSWGSGWGQDGYAWLPKSYLDMHLYDSFQL